MDAHLFRLNHQMHQQQQYNQNFNNTTNNRAQVHPRGHYSTRQQQQHQQQQQLRHQASVAGATNPVIQHQHQPQQQQPHHTTTNSTASDPDDRAAQLSSINSSSTSKTTNSSQAPILSRSAGSGAEATTNMNHHHHTNNNNARRAAMSGHHRQVAAGAHLHQQQSSSINGSSSRKQLINGNATTTTTTASSGGSSSTETSEHHLDELHRLATGASKPLRSAAHRSHHHHLIDHHTSQSTTVSGPGGRFLLGVLFTLAELLLVASLLLWLYWAYQHDDGLAWQGDRKQQFNAHASLMLFGLVFLSGQAILVHRAFQCCSRIYTKILHTILFVLATSAIGLGLILAYTAQENVGTASKPIMHFYSLHAWCGLATVGLFALQFAFGFVSFLVLLCCDQATSSYRAALLPIHRTFGLIIFSLAVATSLMGLLQTARSRLSSKLGKIDYHELAEPGIVINLIGVCLICLAILMPYIIRNLDIKRPFRTELDRQLSKLSQFDLRI